ncbi:MAG: hypothetical protein PHV30_04990 [Candidatus Margulisbacteria bacterium]|nr:hypothetical protein [Candidatus Margulisiibacteriota bacterium]
MSWITQNNDIGSGLGGYASKWSAVTNDTVTVLEINIPSTNSSTTNMVGATGNWWLHLRAVDMVGNWGVTVDHIGPFLIDRISPDSVANLGGNYPTANWVSINIITASWTIAGQDSGGSGIASYSVLWDNNSNTEVDNIAELGGAVISTRSFALSNTNNWYFHIRAMDLAGNWSATVNHIGPFWIDNENPDTIPGYSTSNITTGNWTSVNQLVVTFSAASDQVSMIGGYSIVWDSNAGTLPDTVTENSVAQLSSSTINIGSTYNYWVHIRPVDKAGNGASSALNVGPFKTDIIPPLAPAYMNSSILTGNWRSTNNITVTWNAASDADGSGIQGYSFLWTTANSSTPDQIQENTAGQLSAATLNLTDDNWYLHIRAVDIMGNWANSSNVLHVGPFKLDVTTPGTVNNLISTLAQPTQWTSRNRVTINWTNCTDLSGVVSYCVLWDTTSQTLPANINLGTVLTTAGILADGKNHYFHIRAVDAAGNMSVTAAQIGPFYIDTVSPNQPADQGIHTWTTQNTVGNLTFIVVDNTGAADSSTSGVKYYYMHWSTQDTVGIVTSFNNTGQYTPSISYQQNGEYKLWVKVEDNAGNMTDWKKIYSYQYSLSAPDVPKNLKVYTQASGTEILSRNWQQDNMPYLTWEAPGSSFAPITTYNIYYEYGGQVILTASLVSSDLFYQFVNPLPNDLITLSVEAVDQTGQRGNKANYPFWVDLTVPLAPVVNAATANGGPSIMQNDWQQDRTPYFSWSTPNNTVAGIRCIKVSIDVSVPGVTNNTSALDVTTALSNGTHNFYVQAYSASGVTGNVATFTILMDDIHPTYPTVSAWNNSGKDKIVTYAVWQNDDTLYFEWKVPTNTFAPIVSYSYFISGNASGITDTPVFEMSSPLENGRHTLDVSAKSDSDVWGVTYSFKILIDDSMPVYKGNTIYGNYSNETTPTIDFNDFIEISPNFESGIDYYEVCLRYQNDATEVTFEAKVTTSQYKVPPGKIVFSNEGEYRLWVKAFDIAGNHTEWNTDFRPYGGSLDNGKTYVYRYEKTPPGAPEILQLKTISINGTTINQSEWQPDDDPWIQWKLNFRPPSGVRKYEVWLDTTKHAFDDAGLYEIEYAFTADSINNGRHTINIIAISEAGARSDTTNYSLFVDDSAPTISYQPNLNVAWTTNNSIATINFAGGRELDTPNESLITYNVIYWGTDINGVTTKSVTTLNEFKPDVSDITVSGTYYLRVKVVDNAGNGAWQTVMQYQWDDTTPDYPISFKAYKDSSKIYAITDNYWTSDRTPYFEWSTPNNTMAPIVSFNLYDDSGNSITVNSAFYQYGSALVAVTYNFFVRAKSASGLWGPTVSYRVFIDDRVPSAPISLVVSDNNNNIILSHNWQRMDLPKLSWIVPTNTIAPIDKVAVWYDAQAKTWQNITDQYNFGSVIPNGRHTINVQLRSSSDVLGITGSYSVWIDNVAPTTPNPTSNIGWTSRDTVGLITFGKSWESAVTGSGFAGYEFYWGTDDMGQTVVSVHISSVDNYYLPDILDTAGTYNLRVRVSDYAGNSTNWSTLFQYKFDNITPNQPSELYAWTSINKQTTINNESYQECKRPYFEWHTPVNAYSGIKRFEYKMDNGNWISTKNSSFLVTSDLSLDKHIFWVRAISSTDIVGDIATYGVWIDYTVPDSPRDLKVYSIKSGVNQEQYIVSQDEWWYQKQPYLEWTTPDNVPSDVSIVTYCIKLNGVTRSETTQTTYNFASALAASNIPYLIEVQAKYTIKWGSSVSLSYYIDDTKPNLPPVIFFTTKNGEQIVENGWYSVNKLYFEITSPNNGYSPIIDFKISKNTVGTNEHYYQQSITQSGFTYILTPNGQQVINIWAKSASLRNKDYYMGTAYVPNTINIYEYSVTKTFIVNVDIVTPNPIANLTVRTSVDGSLIPQNTWQTDNTPYLSWDLPINTVATIDTVRILIDNSITINLANTLSYQFSWGLDNARHTLNIQVRSESGLWSSPVYYSLYVDKTTPDYVEISKLKTDEYGTDILEKQWTNDNDPYFKWKAPDNTVAPIVTYHVWVSSPNTVNPYAVWKGWDINTSNLWLQATQNLLYDGQNTLNIEAISASGVTGNRLEIYIWADKSIPRSISRLTAYSDLGITLNLDRKWQIEDEPLFVWVAPTNSASGITGYRFAISSWDWFEIVTGNQAPGYKFGKGSLENGKQYALEIWPKSAAGIYGDPVTIDYWVDIVTPDITYTAVRNSVTTINTLPYIAISGNDTLRFDISVLPYHGTVNFIATPDAAINSKIPASVIKQDEYTFRYLFNSPWQSMLPGSATLDLRITNDAMVAETYADRRIIFDYAEPTINKLELLDRTTQTGNYTDERELIVNIDWDDNNKSAGFKGWYITENSIGSVKYDDVTWQSTLTEYTLTNNINGIKNIWVWLCDIAGWTVSRHTQIILDTKTPTINIDIDNTVTGSGRISVNVTAVSGISLTPDVWYIANGQSQKVNIIINSRNGAEYYGTFNVTSFSGDGTAQLYSRATSNVGNVGTAILGEETFMISTDLKVPSLSIYDVETGSTNITNLRVIGVRISEDEQARYWLIKENSTAPGTSDSLWSNSKPVRYTFQSEDNGVKSVYVWLKNANGAISGAGTATINYDKGSPYIQSIEVRGGSYQRTTTNITINVSEALLVTPQIWITINATKYDLVLGKIDNWTYISTININNGTEQGTAYFGARLTDNVGNTGTYIQENNGILIDTTTVNISVLKIRDRSTGSELYTNKLVVDLVIEGSDSVSGIRGWVVSENEGADMSNISWNEKPASYVLSRDIVETKNIYVWARDMAGNVSSRSAWIIYDNAVPGVIISINPVVVTGAGGVTVSVEDISGVNTPDVWYIANGHNEIVNIRVNSRNGIEYYGTFNVTSFTGDGTANCGIRVTDNAGNILDVSNYKAFMISTDLKVPSVSIYDVETGSTNITNLRVIGVRISEDEQARYWLIKENNNAPAVSDSLWSSSKPVRYTFQSEDNGVKSVYVWLRNANGAISGAGTVTINYDDVKPYVSLVDIFNSPYVNSGNKVITINLSEAQTVTPEFWVSINAIKQYLVLKRADNQTFTTNILVTSGIEGRIEFGVKMTDNANNIGDMVAQGRYVTVDVTVPAISLLKLQDKDSSSQTWSNERGVDIEISGSDASGIVGWITTENAALIPTWGSIYWGDKPISYMLNSGQGTHNVYVWAKDRALNTVSAGAWIIYDGLEPSVNVEMDKDPAGVGTGEVKITLNVSDVESGIASTPDLWVKPNGRTHIRIELTGRYGNSFSGSWNITTYTGDGTAEYEVYISDNARNISNRVKSITYTGNLYANSFMISTNVKKATMNIYDLDTLDGTWTNDQVIGVRIGNDEQATGWLLSEDDSIRPVSSDSSWVGSRPVRYTFKNQVNELKTLYLWTKNIIGNVSEQPVIATINYDDVKPYVSLVDIFNSPYVNSGNKVITINLSEAQTVTPEFWVSINAIKQYLVLKRADNQTFTTNILVTSGIEGRIEFGVKMTDNANNIGDMVAQGRYITVDATKPAISLFRLTDTTTESQLYTNRTTIRADIQATDTTGVNFWIITENMGFNAVWNDAAWQNDKYTSYQMNNSQGTHNLTLWVMDKALNIVTGSSSIILDNLEPSISVAINYNPVLTINNMGQVILITMNITQIASGINITPNLYLNVYQKQPLRLTINNRVNDSFTAILTINEYTGNGPAYFSADATDNATNISHIVRNLFYQGATLTNNLIFQVNLRRPTFNLFDLDTYSTEYTNDSVLGISYNYDVRAISWLINETTTVKPETDDPLWQSYLPSYFILKNNENRLHTVYLWTKDIEGNINNTPAIATINYDNIYPYAEDIQLERGNYIKACVSRITVNISEEVNVTPDLSLIFGGSSRTVTIDYFNKSVLSGLFKVSDGENGKATINLIITDNVLNVTRIIPAGLTRTITFDTVNPPLPTMNVWSTGINRPENITGFSNVLTLNVAVRKNIDYFKYFIQENVNTPDEFALGWIDEPNSYVLMDETQGTRSIYLWIKDRAGNISNYVSVNIVYDTFVPTGEIAIVSDKPSRNMTNTLRNNLSITRNSATYFIVTENSVFRPPVLADNWSSVKPTEYTFGQGEGEKTLYLWLMDNAGNINTQNIFDSITYDKTTPNVSISTSRTGWVSTGNIYITINISEGVITTPQLSYTAAGVPHNIGILGSVSSRDQYYAVLLITDNFQNGILTFNIIVTDDAGNVRNIFNSGPATINIDTIMPDITTLYAYDNQHPSRHDLTNDWPFNISWNISELTIGGYFITDNSELAGKDISNWTGSKPTTYTPTRQYQGEYTFYGWVKDYANNISARKIVAISYDSLAPTATIIMIPPDNGSVYLIGEYIGFTININENIASYHVYVNNFYEGTTYEVPHATTKNPRLLVGTFNTFDLGTNGTYYFQLYVEDEIGNNGIIGNVYGNDPNLSGDNGFDVGSTIDTFRFKIIDKDGDHNANPERYTNATDVWIEIWGASTATSYNVTDNLTFKPDISEIKQALGEYHGVQRRYDYELKPIPGGQEQEVALNTWITDGNEVNGVTKSYSIILDRKTPQLTLDINNQIPRISAGSHNLTLNINEYISEAPDLSIKFSDGSTSVITMNPAGFSDANGYYDAWGGVLDVNSNTPRGTATFSVTVYDKAGNITHIINSSSRSTYNISVIPNPSFNLSDRDGLAMPGYTNENNISINITLAAFAEKCIITENLLYYPTYTDSFWKSMTPMPTTCNLDGPDGYKTVIFWVKDNEENINTGFVTSGITLDTTPPTLNISLADSSCGIGIHNISLSMNEQVQATPCVSYRVISDSVAVTRFVTFYESLNNEKKIWKGNFYIGNVDFNEVITFNGAVTDNAGNIGNVIYGFPTFSINTKIQNPTIFYIYDTDTSSNMFVNDFVVGVHIEGDGNAAYWMISDIQSTKPTYNALEWSAVKPSRYTMKNVVNENKKLYLWVRDAYRNVNDGVVSTSIFYDDTLPLPVIEFNHRDYLKEGEYAFTVNIHEETIPLLTTPQVFVNHGVSIDKVTVSSCDVNNFVWVGTLNINADMAEGLITLSVGISDNAQNYRSVFRTNIVDKTKPQQPDFELSDPDTFSHDFTNESRIRVSINFDADIYGWYISDQISSTPGFMDDGWQLTKPTNFDISSNVIGTKNIRLWVQDKAGNISGTSTKSIYFDNLAPTATIEVSNYPLVKAGVVQITLNISEQINAVTLSYTLYGFGQTPKVITLNQKAEEQYTGSFNISSNDPNGEALFKVDLVDRANNYSNRLEGNIIFRVDTVTPQVIVKTSPEYYLNETILQLTIDVSEIINTTPSVLLKGDSAVALNLTKNNLLQWTGQQLISGVFGYNRDASMSILVIDDAGNATTNIRNFVIDKTSPAVTISSIEDYPDIGIGQHKVTVDISEWTVDTPDLQMQVKDGSFKTVNLLRSAGNAWVGDIVILGAYPEGIATLQLTVRDFAQNETTVHSGILTFNILISMPDPTLDISDKTSNDHIYTNEAMISVSIGNDTRAIKWMVSEEQSSMPLWNATGWQDLRPDSYTLIPGSDGLRKVFVWVQDGAKNVNKLAVSKNIILDTVSPNIVIELSKKEYVNQGDLRLTLSVSEEIIGTPELKMVYADGTTLNVILAKGSGWTYTSAVMIGSDDPQGLTRIFVRATDNALNVGAALVGDSSFVLDTTINVPVNFQLFDQDNPANSDETNDLRVGVRYDKDTDYLAWIIGEGDNIMSDRPTITDNRWQYTKPLEYNFKNVNVEEKKVYLWVRDLAGNISSEAASVNINYNPQYQDIVAYVRIDLNSIYVSYGELFITTNINEANIATPSTWIMISGNKRITINYEARITTNYETIYLAKASIPADHSWDGEANFELVVTKGNGTVLNFTNSNYVNIAGDKDFVVDTVIALPTGFQVLDKDSRSPDRTNDLIVDVAIDANNDYTNWIIGEEFSQKPEINNIRWKDKKPDEYMLKNLQAGVRTIYLWVKDRAGNISSESVRTQIEFSPQEIDMIQYANVKTSKGVFIIPGLLDITINIKEFNTNVPKLALVLANDNVVNITLNFIQTANIYGTFFHATMNIPDDENYAGEAYFQMQVTRNDNSLFKSQTKEDAKSILAGDSVVKIYIPVIGLVSYNILANTVFIGEEDVPVMEITLNNTTEFSSIESVQIFLSGNIFDTDITALYLARETSINGKESIVPLTSKAGVKNKIATLKFNTSEIPAINGSRYLLLVNVNKYAVVDNQYQIVIEKDDLTLDDLSKVNQTNFPIISDKIDIIKQHNRVLYKHFFIPTSNVRQGANNCILSDFSLRVIEGNSYLSNFTINKSQNAPDTLFSNIKLFKKNNGVNNYDLKYDDIVAENLSFTSNVLNISFAPVKLLNEEEQHFYLVSDLNYIAGNIPTFDLMIVSTDSFLLDNNSMMLDININNSNDTFNLLTYIPRISTSRNIVLDDALFENTSKNIIFRLGLSADHNQFLLTGLVITTDYQGSYMSSVYIGTICYKDGTTLDVCEQQIVNGRNTLNFIQNVTVDPVSSINMDVYLSLHNINDSSIELKVQASSLIGSERIIEGFTSLSLNRINIRNVDYPHKARVILDNQFVNNINSFNALVTYIYDDNIKNILCRITDIEENRIALNWVTMDYKEGKIQKDNYGRNIEFATMNITSMPFRHAQKYKMEIKAINNIGKESEIYSWEAQADLTQPVFVNKELLVKQEQTNNIKKHVIFFGPVVEDVSGVEAVELWFRTGKNPEWKYAKMVSGNNDRVEMSDLLNNTSYYYRVRALNGAKLYSDYFIANKPITTSLPGDPLTELTNYPNPFDSRKIKTTITYFLNADININIKIYNYYGKLLYSANYTAGQNGGCQGSNEVQWDGTDQAGNKMPMGGYPMVIYDSETKTILGKRIIGVVH